MKFIIVLLILSFFSAFVYSFASRFSSKFLTPVLLFGIGMIVGMMIPLSESILERVVHLLQNLLPAVLFLIVLDFDPECWMKTGIGCACKIGAKRYWLLVVSALLVSLVSQMLSVWIFHDENWLVLSFIGVFFGTVASWTPLKRVGGSRELAMTLSLLLSILAGFCLGVIYL